MASLMTINLNKNAGTSWGFRLQGGKDFATPLCIQKVNVGSVAERLGLQAGDAIVSINGQDALALRHKEAQDAIVRAGNSFELVVQRGAHIWKPLVTALPEKTTLPDGVPVATKTSLAANQKAYRPIGSGHNTTAAPFGEQKLVNLQYNSPLPLYSEDSIAETLSAQAEVLDKGVLGINFKKYAKEEKIRTDSPTYRLLHGEEEPMRKPRPPLLDSESGAHPPFHSGLTEDHHKATPPPQSHPSGQSPHVAHGEQLQPGENVCSACQRLIVGVFVRIKNKNLHAECFKCSTCGSSLKNVGYYNINGKLYCDIHAKQAARANPPAPNMDPITVQPGTTPPAGAMMSVPSGKMKIPSAFQHDKGHAPAPAPTAAPESEVPEPVPYEVSEPAPEPVNERSPVPAPNKPFVPAPAPAPVPVAAAPLKPAPHAPVPSFCSAANPQGFGAPAGDINVRSHIPKKAVQNAPHWPPHNFIPDLTEPTPSPALQPHKKKPTTRPLTKPFSKPHSNAKSVPMPFKPLPTSKHLHSSKAKGPSFPVSRPSKAARKSPPRRPKAGSPHKPTLRLYSDRFPNPAPSYILKFSAIMETADESHLYGMKDVGAGVLYIPDTDPEDLAAVVTAAAFAHGDGVAVSGEGAGVSYPQPPHPHVKTNISPIKSKPVQEPMPTVNFHSTPTPKITFEEALRHYAFFLSSNHSPPPKPAKSVPASKSLASRGFKAVHSPAGKGHAAHVEPKAKVKLPELTPVEPVSQIVIDVNTMKVAEHTTEEKGDVPAPMTYAPAPVPVPAPYAPAPAPVPVPAPYAPAPAPVPAPFPGFGSSTMPKPLQPPMIVGKVGPGGPTRGVPQAPGHRSAPRRGRGVMNQASASRIPMCAICQRQIRGPFVSALGKTWCPDHFVCATSNCRKNLIDMGFVEEHGELYCEHCYESYLAPICGKCDKRVKGDCLNAVGKQFHPECFCCAYCGKVFGSGAFYLEDGLPYCETDWNELFTTKCVGCNFPIEAGDRWVEALNNNYHSQCFKCSKCNKNLEGQSFFAKGGKPFCKAHAQRGF